MEICVYVLTKIAKNWRWSQQSVKNVQWWWSKHSIKSIAIHGYNFTTIRKIALFQPYSNLSSLIINNKTTNNNNCDEYEEIKSNATQMLNWNDKIVFLNVGKITSIIKQRNAKHTNMMIIWKGNHKKLSPQYFWKP